MRGMRFRLKSLHLCRMRIGSIHVYVEKSSSTRRKALKDASMEETHVMARVTRNVNIRTEVVVCGTRLMAETAEHWADGD